MNSESANFAIKQPEYTEHEDLTKVLETNDLSIYSDELIDKAERQAPGFIERRVLKLSKLPILKDEDFIKSSTNRFVSSNPEHIDIAQEMYKGEMEKSLQIDGRVDISPELNIFIEDLCNIFPRIMRSEGAEKVVRFNPNRIVFVDVDQNNSEDLETLRQARQAQSFRAFFQQSDQRIVIDADFLNNPAELVFTVIHELVHASGFNSRTINFVNHEKKKINIDDRRMGLATVVRDNGEFENELVALNESTTEAIAEKVCRMYFDIFPYAIDAVDRKMEQGMEENKAFEADIGEVSSFKLQPFEVSSGFKTRWNTTVDISSRTYDTYLSKYDSFFHELASKNDVTYKKIIEDILPKLKDAYLNGRMLPFYRAMKAYGVTVDDLVKKDKEIIKSVKNQNAQ